MSADRNVWWGRRRVNFTILGGVSAGKPFNQDRIDDALEALGVRSSGDELAPGREDVYKTGKRVSFEDAAETQLKLQEGLDGEVERENLGETPIVRGLPPCKRTRKSF